MKVQLLKRGIENQEYVVIFAKRDEVFPVLQEFAEKYQIQSAYFNYSRAKWSYIDLVRSTAENVWNDSYPQSGGSGVSMIGDIALYQRKPTVHKDMVVGLPDGTTKGGHVLNAHVSPTLEVMVTVDR
jgi:predicted DNA-binding protein with PD1-like motif